jgi:hypothetical protein
MAKDSEIGKEKGSITSPAPKKSILDQALSWLPRTIALIRIGHWLCAPYVKGLGKIETSRFLIHAGGVASIELLVPTYFRNVCTLI